MRSGKLSRVIVIERASTTITPAGTETVAGTTIPEGIQVGNGVRPASIAKLFTQGNMIQTGNELDLVIEGDGYTRKINCGGSSHQDYEADWKSGQSAASNDLAGVVFDTELLRYAAGWSGGFVQLRGVAFDGGHGVNPGIAGTQIMGTRNLPGWTTSGSFVDPRPQPFGPLAPAQGKYHGLFRYCLLYTSDAADELTCVDLGGRHIIKKKK